MTRFVVGLFSVSIMVLGMDLVSGQDYPNKTIRIVTSGVGGGSDFSARLIAPGLAANLGQPVIVENRPAGTILAMIVSRASPDGYTLMVGGTTLWISPLLRETPYDTLRDFSPISMMTLQLAVLTVHPSMPVKSVKELIDLAKAKPGVINYGSGPTGSSSFLAAALFKTMADINIVNIRYPGNALAMNSLLSNEVQLSFPSAPTVAPFIRSGQLRALAVTSAQPSALLPGLPTVAASGLPGYEAVSMDGLFAPAKTPASLINRLNQEIVRVLNTADVKEKYFNTGIEIVGSSPKAFAAAIKSEIARTAKMIKDASIRDDTKG